MCVLPLFDRRSLNSTESRGSVFGMMTGLRHGCPRNHVSILGRVKVFISCPKHPDLFCHPPCLLSVGTGASFFFPRSMELTIHFHRVSRSRMGGAVPPLSRTPSWRAHGQPDTRSISKPPFFPDINPLTPTGHVMHQQFNIQQLYALPTLYLCVLYLSENKQRIVPLTA